MTEEDKRQLSIFESRFRQLLYQYDILKQKNESLRQEILQKDEEIKNLKIHCQQAETNYSNLKAARIISINDDESHNTKQRLTKLVREIDKCIALLNG